MVLSSEISDVSVTFSERLSDTEVAKISSRHKLHGKEDMYKKCYYRKLYIAVGNFVYVSNDKSRASDSSVRYAAVIAFYKNPEASPENRAIVQWYTRPDEISKHTINEHLDSKRELVLDERDSNYADIPVEKVVDKFHMIFCQPSQHAREVLCGMHSKSDMYVCRYKIVFANGQYCLVPLNTQNRPVATNQTPHKEELSDKENHPLTGSLITEPYQHQLSPSKRKCIATPTKIVDKTVREVDDNSETASPQKRLRKNQKYETGKNVRGSVRRNLNVSLNNDDNYSVEQQGDLKIKLTNNHKRKSSSHDKNIEHSEDEEEEVVAAPAIRTRSKSMMEENNDLTPLKSAQLCQVHLQSTPKGIKTPRKSILKTPSTRAADTPKRNVVMTDIVEERCIDGPKRRNTRNSSITHKTSPVKYKDTDADFVPVTPKKSTKKIAAATPSTPKSRRTPVSKSAQRIRTGEMTPTIKTREDKLNVRRSNVQLVKESLHVSAVPKSLPCREQEFKNIMSFIECKILDKCGGCMYVSGVPGTGKTATVSEVIRALQLKSKAGKLPDFEYVEINGMKMTEPRQAYVHMYRQLTGKTVAWEQAHSLLERRFATAQRCTTVLLVDELDILCTRRQDVVYNMLDWPTKMAARLVVVTIANTMDLPERLLMGKVTSRLGLTRLTFQPYSHKQLQEVVMARLADMNMFKSDAVQLVARKVASVSGDCRRALDICRRAIEIAEAAADNGNVQVAMGHVQQAFAEMISSSKVQAIKGCSKMEQYFLQAITAEVTRTGVEETTFLDVYTQFESILLLMGIKVPPPGRAMLLSSRLGSSKLILSESSRNDIYQKILLNVSSDDIHYALHAKI